MGLALDGRKACTSGEQGQALEGQEACAIGEQGCPCRMERGSGWALEGEERSEASPEG